jgi:putative phosphoribosyl transferase
VGSVLAVTIDTDGVTLPGDLSLPDEASGVVVFAHGSGSSRLSPRNLEVARGLGWAGFGTLLFDLLTAEEERLDAMNARLRFDIAMLARRLTGVIDWLDGQGPVRGLPRGLFGASTGAAAALVTAADRPGQVRAVVSRGGRPDLAGAAQVLRLNEAARRELPAVSDLAVVAGAGHLFEEPGAMGEVTALAATWFTRYLL